MSIKHCKIDIYPNPAATSGFLDLEQVIAELESGSNFELLLIEGLGDKTGFSPVIQLDVSLYRKWELLLERLRNLKIPSVAVVDGYCSGLSLEVVLSADVSVATENASFRMPEVGAGYLPGLSIFRLAKQVGLGNAKRFLLRGEVWSADQARQYGLIDEFQAQRDVHLSVASLVEQMSPEHFNAFRMGRRLLDESFGASYEDFLGRFLAAQHRCFATISKQHFA